MPVSCASLSKRWQPGVWRTILTEDRYPIKAVFASESNPLCAHANPDKFIVDAVKRLEFIVWTDIMLNPSGEWADIVLPVSTPFERNWVTPTNEVGLMAGQKIIEPLYESKSDFDIYRELCVRWGRESVWPWKTEEEWCDWQLEEVGITFKELDGHPTGRIFQVQLFEVLSHAQLLGYLDQEPAYRP